MCSCSKSQRRFGGSVPGASRDRRRNTPGVAMEGREGHGRYCNDRRLRKKQH
jgi:hypothetical protein